MRIPLSYNEIDQEGLMRILRQFEGVHYEKIVSAFEEKFAGLLGADTALAVQSGTAALHLALKVAGVKPGDFVIAPTFCYVAAISPIIYCGAQPYFIDASDRDWNMDVVKMVAAIDDVARKGGRVGAVVVVHNYGYPCAMEEIRKKTILLEIPVIEDCAESLMSYWGGRATGTIGDFGVFSFNNNKTVTAFGGGALISSRPGAVEEARKLAGHALEEVPYYLHKKVGYNYRMSAIQAAYGLSQFERMDEFMQRRRYIDDQYRRLLQPQGFTFQEANSKDRTQPWLSACLLPGHMEPATVAERLKSGQIEARRLWNPMHSQPAFSSFPTANGGVAEKLFKRGICLPMGRYGTSFSDPCDAVVELLLDSKKQPSN